MVLTGSLLDDIKDDIKSRLETLSTDIAVGTGDTTPTSSDTALETEVFRDSVDNIDTSVSNAVTVTLDLLTTEANGNTLTETGIFNDPSAGTMWTRNTFTSINKTSDINLFLDTTFTISVIEG